MSGLVRCVVFAAIALFGAIGMAAPAAANPKYAAYVVHADSGDVLLDKNSNIQRYPASLTKMMTLYLLFDAIEAGDLHLDTELKISARAQSQPPSKLGLTAGETIPVETAIYALVVKSANDVAVVVAENLSGSEAKFAEAMTKKARELGMSRTTFQNASGLPSVKQLSTARDLATLSRRIMSDHPQYFPYFGALSFEWDGRTYRGHNGIVRTYPGADGLKTGYTQASGFNLATTASRDGHRLVGIVLGGRSVRTRDNHMAEILDAAFAQIKSRPMLISALHREKPEPRLKPTLVATIAKANALANAADNALTISGNPSMQDQIAVASLTFAASSDNSPTEIRSPLDGDDIAALIAVASNRVEQNPASLANNQSYQSTSADAFFAEQWGEGDYEDRLDWAVQIGAFSTKAMAQSQLEGAAAAAGLLDRSRSVAPLTQPDGATIYRARFTSLSEVDAAALCETLRRVKQTCFSQRELSAIGSPSR